MDRTSQGQDRLSPDEIAAWKGMLRAHRDLVARLDAQLEREHALPLSSYEVLMVLADSEGGRARMGELADQLLLSRSGLTRLVDRLVRQGWVERAPCEDDDLRALARVWDRLDPYVATGTGSPSS